MFLQKNSKKGEGETKSQKVQSRVLHDDFLSTRDGFLGTHDLPRCVLKLPNLLMNRDFDSEFSILSHIAILSLSSKIEMVNRAAINPIIKSNPNSFDSKWKE